MSSKRTPCEQGVGNEDGRVNGKAGSVRSFSVATYDLMEPGAVPQGVSPRNSDGRTRSAAVEVESSVVTVVVVSLVHPPAPSASAANSAQPEALDDAERNSTGGL